MTLTHEPRPPEREINTFAPELLDDPYPWYAEVRQMGIFDYVLPQLPGRAVMISHWADVQAVLRDNRFGRAGFRQNVLNTLGPGALAESYSEWFLFQDPPDHSRLRGLVSKAFTPRAVENMRSSIARVVEELLDGTRGLNSFDLMSKFAYQVPVLVICDLLGVPAADRGRFSDWSAALAKGLDQLTMADPAAIRLGNEAAAGLTAYFERLVEQRRASPGDDLLSAMITAEEAGDRLSTSELMATCVLLFFAGHETTVNLIGNGSLALLRNRSQMDRLVASPSLIANAVEEFLRYDSPVQRSGRIALEDVEFKGRLFQAGWRVNLLIGAANRDPLQFASPDELDIGRANAATHLSFAAGIHYCVGAPLARLEAQLAIGGLLRRYPTLRLLTEKPVYRPTFVLRGLAALEVAPN